MKIATKKNFKLRPFQEEGLHSLIHHDHTVLIAPTGSGKSLIFQKYLSIFKNTRALLVSPLNALARQHEQRLHALEIPVYQGVGSEGVSPSSGPGVWILNPEKLCGKFFESAKNWRADLIIVDEAHCVWEWGESFRPEFLALPGLVKTLRIKKSFWCTATLPKPAWEQIETPLDGKINRIGNFSLPPHLNIVRMRVSPHSRMELLRSILESNKNTSGMIFVSTRNSSEMIQNYLEHWGIVSIAYHAGMSFEERVNLEARLEANQSKGEPIWVVATSAFGMGMDYSFLRTCILFEPSFSLLALAQALGRVGRAGERAQAYVFWHENDFERFAWLTEKSDQAHQHFLEVKEWCLTSDCQRAHLEKYFNGASISG